LKSVDSFFLAVELVAVGIQALTKIYESKVCVAAGDGIDLKLQCGNNHFGMFVRGLGPLW
jgi:hypothetical protein